VKFYLNGALKATHSTNIPVAYPLTMSAKIEKTANSSTRRLKIDVMRLRQSFSTDRWT
jgi:hypothetical protein